LRPAKLPSPFHKRARDAVDPRRITLAILREPVVVVVDRAATSTFGARRNCASCSSVGAGCQTSRSRNRLPQPGSLRSGTENPSALYSPGLKIDSALTRMPSDPVMGLLLSLSLPPAASATRPVQPEFRRGTMNSSSRPKPVNKEISTSRVKRGVPYRISAIPPIMQKGQPWLSRSVWRSRAALRSSFIRQTRVAWTTRSFANSAEPCLLFDKTRSGRRRQEEQMLHTSKELPDCFRHADCGSIADSHRAKFGLGLPPDFGPAAH
jgi:hypothetical protein